MAVIITAEKLPTLSAVCGLPPSLTLTVKKATIENMIPAAATNNGNTTADIPPNESPLVTTVAPNTIVAKSVDTNEPNRSAPIPATSPTLSPTLSAITAGLRGSSSGIPASTFPTRSAPTSAALV